MRLTRTQVHCTLPIKISNYPLSIFFWIRPCHLITGDSLTLGPQEWDKGTYLIIGDSLTLGPQEWDKGTYLTIGDSLTLGPQEWDKGTYLIIGDSLILGLQEWDKGTYLIIGDSLILGLQEWDKGTYLIIGDSLILGPQEWDKGTYLIIGDSLILGLQEWDKGTYLIIGDSLSLGLQEKKMDKNVKIRGFSGASINDLYTYLLPLIKISNVLLMTGTNDAMDKSSDELLTKLMTLKNWILAASPGVNITIFCPTIGKNNQKPRLTILHLRKK